jgi:hypothetical protein
MKRRTGIGSIDKDSADHEGATRLPALAERPVRDIDQGGAASNHR